jgi:hypothetical protein
VPPDGQIFLPQTELAMELMEFRAVLEVQSGSAQYNGLADCLLQTARTEGVQALWKGLTPALVRQAQCIQCQQAGSNCCVFLF